jgi:hypothetical protein
MRMAGRRPQCLWSLSASIAGLLLAACLICSQARAAEPADDSALASTGKHCLGSAQTKLVVGETVLGSTNPLGAENDLTLGICSPLIRKPGLLFDYTNIQGGLLIYLNPVSVQQGGYFSITPLSIIELRAEAAWVEMWPFPMDGAGYFPLAGYTASYRESDLPADKAGFAHGFTAAARATLQGQVDLSSRLHLLAQDAFGWEYWKIGTEPFYYNVRNGIALARSDYLLVNRASLLMGIDLSQRLDLKVGASDELTLVPRGSYYKNVVGGLAIFSIKGWPTASSTSGSFLRVGAYTAHPFRTGLQLLGGLYTTFEAMRLERR